MALNDSATGASLCLAIATGMLSPQDIGNGKQSEGGREADRQESGMQRSKGGVDKREIRHLIFPTIYLPNA